MNDVSGYREWMAHAEGKQSKVKEGRKEDETKCLGEGVIREF